MSGTIISSQVSPATKARPSVKRFLASTRKLPVHIILLVLLAVWITPTLGLFISSFRPGRLILTTAWWKALIPPFRFTLENYSHVLATNGMGRSFFNSLLVAVPSTVMPILIAAFAAYAFSWMRFAGRDFLFLMVIALLVVPIQMTLIPILRLLTGLHLTGTFPGIWIAHAAYGLPLSIYLLRNFIGNLPGEMFESAYLDGATHARIFFSLVIPTSVPALASLTIFQFMYVWNDLLVALIYLGGTPSVAPMTVTVSNLVNSYGAGWQFLTAAAFISMMLPLIVFLSLQRYFIKGITTGAVKG